MNTYRTCPECGRQIAESIFSTSAGAHGPGCKIRRSLKGKQAYEEKRARKARAQKAAETRARKRAAAAEGGPA